MSGKTNSLSRKFRNAFLTGLIIFLPLGTTIFVLNFLLGLFEEPVTQLAYELGLKEESVFFGMETLLAVLGLLIGVLSLTLLGFLSNYFLGRVFINLTEKILDKVPFLSTVYRSAKQIVETFGKENRAVFNEVVLIEYPEPVVTAGIRNHRSIDPNRTIYGKKTDQRIRPTTPIPRVVFFCFCPKRHLFPDMTVGEGMKMLISGGAVSPPVAKSKTKGSQRQRRTQCGSGNRKPRSPARKSPEKPSDSDSAKD